MDDIQGAVKDAEWCSPLEKVALSSYDFSGSRKGVGFSDSEGNWRLEGPRGDDSIVFEKEGYAAKRYRAEELPGLVRLLEDKLIGYQERLWFLPGEEITVYVHSPAPFSALLRRHGLRREPLSNLGPYKACGQQTPDNAFVASGLNWEPTFTYRLSEEAKPGLYSLLLEAEAQKPFAIPFVVATPPHRYGAETKLLVLASTTTWQSYNLWGGRSRYRNYEDSNSVDFIRQPPLLKVFLKRLAVAFLPRRLVSLLKRIRRGKKEGAPPDWMFRKLSIRRPFSNCGLEAGEDPMSPFCNHLAAGEWRLLAWLERENIPYDFISCHDLQKNPDGLGHYRAILLSTHCEYWTREMYETLRTHHEREKLWILNLSGNAIYREIKFFEDGSTRCLSLSFHDSCADETQLLGVRFSMSDYGTCAPYRILRPEHYIFAGLPKDQKVFGCGSLNRNVPKDSNRYDPGSPGLKAGLKGSGASGWETDKLSETAPRGIMIVAKGLNPRGGADMVVREPKGSRGGMFSASSLCFAASLLIDEATSKIVLNVMDKALERETKLGEQG